jgi:hypothetical protein
VNVKPPSKTIPSPGDPAQTVISKDIVSSVFEQWRDDLRAREPRVEEIKSARAAEPLRAQLAQSRETLARLERQRLDRGESDVQLQVQIAYQQDQIAQLEGQLLSVMKDRVVGLIKDIERSVVQSVQSDQVEPGVLSFLQGQRIEVEKQYGQQQPNQDILVAAMGATVLLGERLGDEVVDQRLVRDLASFVPGAMVRRV